jgi:membrane protein implicated in regulation of membrane protease activity
MPDSQTIFIAVGSTGFLILLLSVLLGEIGGHGGELGGHGGELGGHGGPMGDAGDHAAGPHGVPEGSADLDAPTWRSIRVLSVALVGFGAAGFIASSSGGPALLSWPLAAGGFLAVGAAAYRFILKPLAAQQYNSMTSRYGWIGRTGVVTLDVLPHGTGQVTFHDRQGARITQTASSDVSEGIPRGSAVTITDLTPGGVVVHRSAFSD